MGNSDSKTDKVFPFSHRKLAARAAFAGLFLILDLWFGGVLALLPRNDDPFEVVLAVIVLGIAAKLIQLILLNLTLVRSGGGLSVSEDGIVLTRQGKSTRINWRHVAKVDLGAYSGRDWPLRAALSGDTWIWILRSDGGGLLRFNGLEINPSDLLPQLKESRKAWRSRESERLYGKASAAVT